MTYWDILGIEPTDDLSAVKKAYAKMLKLHHPEDDPEGYQRLREAYDAIQKSFKKEKRPPFGTYSVTSAEIEKAPIAVYTPHTDEEADVESREDPVDAFIRKARLLYEKAPERMQAGSWIDLLNEKVLWDLTFKKQAGLQLFDLLKPESHFPQDVWLLLEDSFQWRETYPEFLLEEDPDRIRFWTLYQKHLGFYPSLSFEEAAQTEGINAELFFHKREQALDAFLAGYLQEAETAAYAAHLIFPEDPDLLKLQGEIYSNRHEWEKAVSLFNRYLELKPEDREVKLALARIQYEQGQMESALLLCTELSALYPKHPDILSLQAKCRLKEQELDKALHSFNTIYDAYPHDAESVVYTAKIHDFLWHRFHKIKGKDGLPPRRQLKQALHKSPVTSRISQFFHYFVTWRLFPLILLGFFSWRQVSEQAYSNPFEFMFLILGALLFPTVSLSFIHSASPFVWLAVFIFAFLLLSRLAIRAYRAVRY